MYFHVGGSRRRRRGGSLPNFLSQNMEPVSQFYKTLYKGRDVKLIPGFSFLLPRDALVTPMRAFTIYLQ